MTMEVALVKCLEREMEMRRCAIMMEKGTCGVGGSCRSYFGSVMQRVVWVVSVREAQSTEVSWRRCVLKQLAIFPENRENVDQM
ncbi:hypothetical protein MRB53_013990 [Persea americana]|uniref:Uncharacterized protein n=1 Tax=Persea americana TaxID=3435 RepID=A0ACC2KA21_PERAE|nr:hypothetical protein MRB53_013990 [Persea americana]